MVRKKEGQVPKSIPPAAALRLLGMGARPRSTLSRITLVIGTTGVFLSGVELLIDRYFLGRWQPGWSLVVLTVCAALVIPLIVVRRVPALREEVRRRFHL